MSRLSRIKRSVEQQRDFAEARRILSEEQISSFSDRADGTFVPYKRQATDQTEDMTNIKNDRGNGRASAGIQFLEFVSLSFTGKELNSMLKFDKLRPYVPLSTFHASVLSDDAKISIIARSLGVSEFLDIQKDFDRAFVVTTEKKFLETFEEVKQGTFRAKNAKTLLAFCRTMVTRIIRRRKHG